MEEEESDDSHNSDRRTKWLIECRILSGMSKTDKFLPVVTIVIYLGEEEWDGATDLYEMLELEEELKPYISNYQLNLFDYHKYDSFEFFKGEVKVLFEVLSCVNNKEKMYQILKKRVERKAEKKRYKWL